MEVLFIKDTPHTRREGSKKIFLKGQRYVLSRDYALDVIATGAAQEVKELTLDDLKRDKKLKK